MSSLNLNKVVIGGRLTADPELKQTPSGISLVTFRVAVNRRFQSQQSADGNAPAQQQTDFFRVVAWSKTAEFVTRYFRKGSAICIAGRLQTREWQDQQNQRQSLTEIVAEDVMFVDSKSESGAGGQYVPDAYTTPSYSSAPAAAPKFEELKTDEDLPF